MNCAKLAAKITANAAETKDWRLRRRADREMKRLAKELSEGRGYIIATNYELEKRFPGLFKSLSSEESGKIIWAIDYNQFQYGNKMNFIPVR